MTKGRCGLGGGEAGTAAEHGRKDPPGERPDAADVSRWRTAGHAWALRGEGRGPGTAAEHGRRNPARGPEDATPWPAFNLFWGSPARFSRLCRNSGDGLDVEDLVKLTSMAMRSANTLARLMRDSRVLTGERAERSEASWRDGGYEFNRASRNGGIVMRASGFSKIAWCARDATGTQGPLRTETVVVS